MTSAIGWMRRSALGLGVAAALVFGGYQAFANTATLSGCMYNPPAMGPCPDFPTCQEMCDAYYPPGQSTGWCYDPYKYPDNCCACLFK